MRLLNNFSFKKHRYDRPSSPFVCVHLRDGRPCSRGPAPNGSCRTTHACQPMRKGDRWRCARDRAAGGPCENGPGKDGVCSIPIVPCSPRPSQRVKRGRLVVLIAALTLGLLLIVFNSSFFAGVIDPGALSSAHGSDAVCADCHDQNTPVGGLSDLLAGDRAHQISTRCLDCHSLGSTPRLPHGMTDSELVDITMAHERRSPRSASLVVRAANRLTRLGDGEHSARECGRCHREHQGVEADLTAFADAQCHACHTQVFDSFAANHPAFTEYPYERRAFINFDHASHMAEHFDESEAYQAPGGCHFCHRPSESGQHMVLGGFDDTCAECHLGEILGEGRAGEPGVAFLRLPGIDLDTIASHRWVGEWPEFADARPSPILHQMLADSGHAIAIDPQLDLLDLRNASSEQLNAVADYMWTVKRWFYAFSIRGYEGADPSLLGQLPIATVRDARDAWFPGLREELVALQQGTYPSPASAAEDQEAASSQTSASTVDTSVSEDLLQSVNGDSLLLDEGDDDQLLLGGVDDDNDALLPGGNDDDLLLDGNDGGDLLLDGNGDDLLFGGSDDDDLLLGGNDNEVLLGGDSENEPLSGGADDDAGSTTRALRELLALSPKPDVDWMAHGGWYRDDNTYALAYRPGAHEDLFLQAWIDLAVTEGRAELESELMDPRAVGYCGKCHAVENAATGRHVAWVGYRPPSHRDLNRFDHQPHFNLMQDRGCQHCHELDPTAEPGKAFESGATDFEPAFLQNQREQCLACHHPGGANDGCTACHNYHTGELSVELQEIGAFR